MKLSKCGWLLAITILIVASTPAVAQYPIQLVQGTRIVNDKITFIVEISPHKVGYSQYLAKPEDILIFARFTGPASGMVYVDGKAIGRFDEAMAFKSNPVDITHGRHAVTLVAATPTVVFDFTVHVRGGLVREVFDSEELDMPKSSAVEQRIVGLEQRVHELEAEIAALKKNRVQ